MPHPCASTSLPAGTCCLHQGCPTCRCSNSGENGHQEGQGQTLSARLLQPLLGCDPVQNVQKTAPQVVQSRNGQQHKGCRRWMGLRDLNSTPNIWNKGIPVEISTADTAAPSPPCCLIPWFLPLAAAVVKPSNDPTFASGFTKFSV